MSFLQVPFNNVPSLFACGNGHGQPWCRMIDATTLAPTESRVQGMSFSSPLGNRTRSALVFANNNTLFGGLTRGVYPTEHSYDNLVTAELLADRHKWRFGTSLVFNISASYRQPQTRALGQVKISNVVAVEEAGQIGEASQFLDAWVYNGYIYIAVNDLFRAFSGEDPPKDSNGNPTQDLGEMLGGGIIRICEGETSTPTTPSFFRTVLRGELFMNKSRDIRFGAVPHRVTAVQHTKPLAGMVGEPPVYYITQDRTQWVLSDTIYSGRGGLNYELDGYINRRFWDLSGEPAANFSCNRALLYGTLTQHVKSSRDPSREGWFHRRELVREYGIEHAVDMVVHSELHPTHGVIDEVYVRWVSNLVRKFVVVRETGLAYISGNLREAREAKDWGLLALTEDGTTLLLGGENDLISVPMAECGQVSTCNDCLIMSEFRCGWCAATARCTRQPVCSAGLWHQHLFNATAPEVCEAPVERASFTVASVTATSFTVTVAPPTTAAGSTPSGLEYTLIVDEQALTSSSTATLLASGITPFTSYNVAVEVRSSGGRFLSAVQAVQTLQGPAGEVTELTALAEAGPNVRLSWTAPANLNGVFLGYTVLRNGTQVCCADGAATTYLDLALPAYTMYTYSVHARTGTIATPIEGAVSSTSVRTVATAPSRPLNSAVSNLDQSSVSGVLFPHKPDSL